jgi:hypothetical protein
MMVRCVPFVLAELELDRRRRPTCPSSTTPRITGDNCREPVFKARRLISGLHFATSRTRLYDPLRGQTLRAMRPRRTGGGRDGRDRPCPPGSLFVLSPSSGRANPLRRHRACGDTSAAMRDTRNAVAESRGSGLGRGIQERTSVRYAIAMTFAGGLWVVARSAPFFSLRNSLCALITRTTAVKARNQQRLVSSGGF